MKLNNYLILANLISIAAIVSVLFIFYSYMLLSSQQLLMLSIAAIAAGCVSAGLHFFIMRPVVSAVLRMGTATAEFASGALRTRVPVVGPVELKVLAEQFNLMGTKLEESFHQVKASEKSRRELVANLAHDLRTPLASVQSYVEALEDGVVEDEETFRRYLATIRSESLRLGTLIQDLFELSTLDAEERSQEAVSALLDDVLIELLPRFAKLLEDKSLDLQVKLPEQFLRCQMVPQQVQRIIQNLLENAIRHSPSNGIIGIEVDDVPKGFVRVSVTDQGKGVPDQAKEQIFERFYRLDRSRSRSEGGSGLGLAIAKSLVLQQGGEIGVINRPGGGSCFWFTLPKGDSLREAGRNG